MDKHIFKKTVLQRVILLYTLFFISILSTLIFLYKKPVYKKLGLQGYKGPKIKKLVGLHAIL